MAERQEFKPDKILIDEPNTSEACPGLKMMPSMDSHAQTDTGRSHAVEIYEVKKNTNKRNFV